VRPFRPATAFALALAALATACGGDKLVLPDETLPAAIAVVKGNGQTGTVGALLADSVVVRVTDASGRPVENQPVTFSVTGGGGSLAPATSNTNADGRAGARWTLGTTAGAQSAQAKVTGTGAPANLVAVLTATANPAGAASIAMVSGNNQTGTAGSALTDSLVVVVRDAAGNPVPGVSVAWSAAGGGSVSAPTVVTGPDGHSAVRRTLGSTAGAETTVASSTGLSGSPVTFAATAAVGSAGRLTVTRQPSASAQSGVAFAVQPQVQLQDVNGNSVAQAGIAVTASLGSGPGGTLIGSVTAATNGAGLATFSNLGLNGPAGSYTLNFAGTNLTGATSDPVAIGAGSASRLDLAVPPSATASSGSPLATQPAIQLVDAAGNPVAQGGVTVIAQIQSGTATLSGTTSVVTSSSGRAAFLNLTLSGASGSQATIAFGAGGLAGVVSGTITLGAGTVSGGNSSLSVSGSPITASGGSSAATVTVTARDASGNVIPGAAVSVSVTGSNSITQPAGGVTAANGVAAATVSSSEAGIKTVTATINGTTVTQTATLTVNPAAPSAGHSSLSAAPAGIAAVTGTSTVTVTVRDAFDNPVPGATVLLAATGSGNAITQPVGTTSALGVSIGSLASSTAGAKVVSATAARGGPPVAITQTATVTVGIGNADPGTSTVAVVPSSITVGVGSATVTVTARDAGGNTISGAAVSVSVTGSGNTITPASGATDGSGVFSASLSSLESGTKTVTASVNGTALTAQPTVTVNAATTITTLSLSGSTTLVGQPVTASWTVTPQGSGTPSGNVTVSGGGGSCSAAVGAGSCVLAATTAGAGIVFTATYAGDGDFVGSSGTATRTVGASSTTTAITSDSPDPSNAGQSVTVSYTVTADAPGGGTPSGSVTVSDGVNSCTATVAAGSCAVALSTLGARTLTASYAGNANYAASASPGAPHTVQANGATVAVTGSPGTAVTGQTVTFTATVSGGSGTPAGTVQFSDGAAAINGPVTLNGSGVAQTSTTLSAGSHTITAGYSGGGPYGPGSGSLAYTVNRGGTSVTISGDAPDPSVAGASYTVSFSVFVTSPASGTPSGTVTVSDGSVSCTDAAPVGSCGLASPTSGPKTITVTYEGDADFAPSSKTASHTVYAATATVAVASSDNPSVFGQAVTFTATVSGGAGTPGGSVQFTVDGSPAGSPAALDGSGAATTALSTLAAGSHTIGATYQGDATYASGAGGTLAGGQTVNHGATTTAVTLSSGTNPSVDGGSVSFTATVSPVSPAAGVPGGSVQFTDGGVDIGVAQPMSSGTATLTTSALSPGAHGIAAVYSGDARFTGSTSGGLSHTVTASNTAPTAAGDAYVVSEDGTLAKNAAQGVLSNDSDADSDPISAVLDAGPTHGTLTGGLATDGSFTYTPDPDFNGSDSFTYHASDGTASSSVVTVDITVNPVNDPPAFTAGPDQTIGVGAGAQVVSPWATGVTAGPPDESGQPLSFEITDDTNPGLFDVAPAIAADGTLSYTPGAVPGSATLTVRLSDGGATSPSQTFTITIN
jgi:hypothetical protein